VSTATSKPVRRFMRSSPEQSGAFNYPSVWGVAITGVLQAEESLLKIRNNGEGTLNLSQRRGCLKYAQGIDKGSRLTAALS
jgi:hypothetical protein